MADSPRSPIQHWARLRELIRPYRRQWRMATATLIVGGVITLILPQTVRVAIDRALVAHDTGSLDLVAVLAVVAFLIFGVATAWRHYLMSWLGQRVVTDLRRRTFEHLLHFSPGWFHERKTGELVSRLTDDIGSIQQTVGSELSMALRSLISVSGGLIMLFLTSPLLAALTLLLVPPLAFLAVRFGRKIRKQSKAVQDALAEANGSLKEALGAIDTVQIFNAETHEAARYGTRVEKSFAASLKLGLARGVFVAGVEVAAFLTAAVLLWLGGRMVAAGDLGPGDVGSFLIYTLMIATSLATLANIWGNLQRAMGASERVFELLDEVPPIRDAADAEPLPAPVGGVAFEHVSFRYPARPDIAVLGDVSFEAAPGQVVALVGASGAGKSTIAALVQRFWDPDEGVVRVDGHDVRALRLADLRHAIAAVSQDPVLFSGTLRENILYGRPDAPEAELTAAVADAGLAPFVARLPDGLATLVGERGVKVSGGERQRVAIARALLANPRILVLDEATSHLDAANEQLVQQALERLMVGRTTLVIAHRLSTIRSAHLILVLDHGQIVERGTHEVLAAANGSYAARIARQSGGRLEA